ncbi:helix-turn-helix domain-containing protein [Microvirga calopogonii]|uniref:helix-turn-helix domain-containing protein n=1 Tax=Microvirga calopogonii TaxID=2078013 RepID=UPI000E0DD065|nr:helix-turn-helix domain-containing protein [Microvirga calopogonii]
MANGTIPTYALYGEATDAPGVGWIHCESIQARSRLHDYVIQPHRHQTLFQILHLTQGSGHLLVDGQGIGIDPPCIVTLPPMVVHGYTFTPDVEGTVMTVFANRVAEILGATADLAENFRSVQIVAVEGHHDLAHSLNSDIDAIVSELQAHAPVRRQTMEARLFLIMVALYRVQKRKSQPPSSEPSRSREHALRFRQIVDQDYRSHRRIPSYASQLGITSTHLNRICRETFGETALGLIHQRLVLEAKRYLTFTTLSVKEISFALGFEEPAYFTRLFKQKTGMSPMTFRAIQATAAN